MKYLGFLPFVVGLWSCLLLTPLPTSAIWHAVSLDSLRFVGSASVPRRGVVFGYFVIPNSFRNLYPYALVKDCGLISFTSRPLLEILNQVQDDIFGLVSSPRERGRERG